MSYKNRRGASLIDLLISLGIIVILFTGIYLVFFSILGAASNVGGRTTAVELINQQIEVVRGMSYGSVGTVGGIPAGVLPQNQVFSVAGFTFNLKTTVRNIDDPFDGTTGGNPNDAAPADYKLVQIEADCPTCPQFVPVTFTTTVGPKNLENSSQDGSLFINVSDALINAVPGASVHLVNASVVPSIDLTDTTNASGVLELVGVPTSTHSYQITVTKDGYSTDQTYAIGDPGNPNPLKPHATVLVGTVTPVSFFVDRLSTINVYSSDDVCAPVGGRGFTVNGSRLVGTSPEVLKFSTSSATNASGLKSFSNIEWDTYSFALSGSSYDIAGTMPLDAVVANPSSTANFRFVLKPAADPSLLATVTDISSGDNISGAAVNIMGSLGFSKTLTTGHTSRTNTDWSGSKYSSQDGGIDTESSPGKFTLLRNASGTYNVNTISWLISNTIDMGGSSSTVYSVGWNPVSQPPGAGTGSLKIQLAASNNSSTWNFIGPDGTEGSYFTATGTTTPAALNGNRFIRYKVFLSTENENFSPELDDITLEFNSVCVPPAQVLFTNLNQETYTIDVTAPNYGEATTSVDVGAGFNQVSISLTHL